MPIIMKLDYCRYLLPDEALSLCPKIQKVSEKRVGNVDKFHIESDFSPTIEIVQDSQIVREGTEEEAADYKTLYNDAEKARSDYQSKYWKEQKELEKLKKELETIKSVCPDSHKKPDEVKTEAAF